MIEQLRRRWPFVLATALVALTAMQFLEPHYNQLQTASDAAGFRDAVSAPWRAVATTVVDDVFAIGYGLLGLIGLHEAFGPSAARRSAAVAIVASTTFDIIENAILAGNLARRHTITDAWITVMRVPGTLKWIGSPILLVVLIAVIRREVNAKRSYPQANA